MRKRLWDLAKSRIEIGTILPGHRHKVPPLYCVVLYKKKEAKYISFPASRCCERGLWLREFFSG